MTEQTQKIQNRIRQIKLDKQTQVVAPPLHVPVKPAPTGWRWRGFGSAFLGSCIILMTVATIGLLVNKNSQSQAIAQAPPVVRQPIFVETAVTPVDTSRFLTRDNNFITASEGEAMVSAVQERMDSLESKMDTWQHRTWLLSMAVNENANIAAKYHNAGYITFDKDWKLSGMPTTMNLSEETKAKLTEADVALEAATGVKTTCTSHHYVMESDDMHYHCTKCGARYARQSGNYFKRCR